MHCGELRDDGVLVERALALRPTRIAHGASVATNPSLVADLIARGLVGAGDLDALKARLLLALLIMAGTPGRFSELADLSWRGTPA